MFELTATLEQPSRRTAPMSRKPVPTLYVAVTFLGRHGKQMSEQCIEFFLLE